MKTKLSILIGLACGLALFTGCSTVVLRPGNVEQGVSTGVSLAVVKYPEAIPYLQAAAPVICSAAHGTNLAPAQVAAAIQESDAAAFRNPNAVMILNVAMSLYVGLWERYGTKAVDKSDKLRSYLEATCAGITKGLIAAEPEPAPPPPAPATEFPLLIP